MLAYDPCHDAPGTDESCPGCEATTGVLRTTGTAPTIHTWSCTTCSLNWVISAVNPRRRPLTSPTGQRRSRRSVGCVRRCGR